ncbi:aldehyde dehydrogenase family protein [Elongatibacter sediminis]|uniref:Aldehyde dehydrogenase family protein n=1 Tax=Elongatibacter sediminis TaxID=3119006 RepID=A0AAW9RCU5_9GAMM
MKSDKFYINGQWVSPESEQKLQVINPATESEAGTVFAAGAADVDKAVSAAKSAAETWAATPLSERCAALGAMSKGLAEHADELARTITDEMGMPANICRGYQVEPPAMVIDNFVEIAQEFSFVTRNQTSVNLLEPVGVCALITPWNFPLTQSMLKLAPALAAGCTVVWKPSEETPLSATIFAEIVHQAGLPAGVFNMIHGEGSVAGDALAAHPSVRKVSLTGSTRAGISVATRAAESLKRVTLELGGKSANIICDDADLEAVVPAGVNKCFSNSGQACDAPSRMLVHRSQYDKALELAVAAAESLQVGDPCDSDTDLGPLVNEAQFRRVNDLIETGLREGARLLTGGPGRPDTLTTGYYAKPTVFADVANSMEIARQEIFGPVLCIIPYENDEEAIQIANDSPYGLAAYISTADDARAGRIAKRLQAGQVRINQAPFDITAPFGGYKMSGYGRELGDAGLSEYLEIKACMGLSI